MAKLKYKGSDIFDREPLAYEMLTDNQKRRVDHLRREVHKLSEENKQLKSDIDTLGQMAQTFSEWYVNAAEKNEKIEDLEEENTLLKIEINNLESEKQGLINTIKSLKTEKADKLTVSANAEHFKSELDDLYQDFKELEKSYDALHDVHDELKEHIKGHVERLAYNYNFKESPNGGGLHYCHDFREIADTVGAKIPL